jgi:putative transposase
VAEIASIVEEAIFRYRDGGKYQVRRHVVMPDHVHVILTSGDSTSLEKAVQLIKGGSSYMIGKGREVKFPVWHEGFTEHQIRDARDFEAHVIYVDENPVKAHLAEVAGKYPHGSAAGKFVLDPWLVASGAEAPEIAIVTAGLKPRPSKTSEKNRPVLLSDHGAKVQP